MSDRHTRTHGQLALLGDDLPPLTAPPPRRAITFPIPYRTPSAHCRGCNATIYWLRMPSKKLMPVNPDGTSHFGTCAKAAHFRMLRAQRPEGRP